MFGMLHSGSNLLGVVEALDYVEWDPEWHQLGRLVHDVIGAVEEQVPQHGGDHLDIENVYYYYFDNNTLTVIMKNLEI